MKRKFTQNELIKKLFNEENASAELEETLANDWMAQEEFNLMQAVKDKLDSEIYSPSKTSIQIILDYSKKNAPLETSC